MDEQNVNPLNVPEELNQNLVRALQDIAMYLHESTKMSHVILDIKHISDAMAKHSNTLVTGGALGFKAVEEGEQDKPMEDASKLADEAIERAISAAKKQAQEKKPGEPPQK